MTVVDRDQIMHAPTDRNSAWQWVRWFLLVISIFCGIDLLLVIFGGGMTVRLVGTEIRSTTIEFPAIAFMLSGILALCAGGKWKESLVLCGAIIISGALGELALRVIDHPLAKPHIDYVAWYKPSELYGHELVAGFEGFGPLNVPVKINHDGFRDTPHGKEKHPATMRVLGLGDSFVFGWGVQSEETFLKRLESRLQGRMDRPVEVINAGVPGWGLNQYYIYLREEGLRLSPDLVVLAYFADDLSGPPEDRIPPDIRYAGGLQYRGDVMHHSRLFNFLKSISHLVREKNRAARVSYLHDLEVRRRGWSGRTEHLLAESSPAETERYTGMLNLHLTRSKGLVSAAGSTMVIVYLPDISQLHHPEAQLINRVLHKSCQQLSIPFVDMTPIFEQSQDPARYYLWPQDPHTNKAGHEAIAVALEQIICGLPEWQHGCNPSTHGHAGSLDFIVDRKLDAGFWAIPTAQSL